MRPRRDLKSIIMIITIVVLLILIGVLLIIYFFGDDIKHWGKGQKPGTSESSPSPEPDATEEPGPTLYTVNREGMNIEERFPLPKGYVRVSAKDDSFALYLRKHPLKNYGSPSYTYDDKVNEEAATAGVFVQDITARGLQQHSQALMRLWAEYLFEKEDFEDISFDFYTTPVFKCDFDTWAKGNRPQIEEGKNVSWNKVLDEEDYSYSNLRKYLDMVMGYANSITLQLQLKQVSPNDLSIGDVLIMTAGQLNSDTSLAAIIVDMAINTETNEKIFLIGQGGSPSTETYIVLSDDPIMGPWHKLNSNNELVVGDWTCPSIYFRKFG